MKLAKKHKDTLSTMVLAHRVAVRKHQQAEVGTNAWIDAGIAENITQFALDVALDTEGDIDWKLDYLWEYNDSGNMEAHVAIIRLENLGAIAR